MVDDEQVVLAWLCTRLPELRQHAARDLWEARLDAAIAALRAGTAPTQVCARLGLTVNVADIRAERAAAGPATLGDLGIDPVPVDGDYVCPYGLCQRRGRPDPRGRVPECVDGTPMDQTGR